MRSLPSLALATILAFTGVQGFAQETINKSDLPDPRSSIDQAPISVGEVPALNTPVPVGRVRISNAASQATDASTFGRVSAFPREDNQGQAELAPRGKALRTPSDFQKFVREATGKHLPLFGEEFFDRSAASFSPIPNGPVPSDYVLGPGDEVLVRGWGTIDIDYRATIDRNGVITIPSIGTVVLAGVRAGDASSLVRAAVARLYKGVTLNVSFGQLKGITVYVVGQASKPGTYTVPSTSTLVTALFASGGPNATGSLRRVQVKRNGQVVSEMDLYGFIAKGDKARDIRLLDGDTIYIPVALGHVAFTGKVNRSAIYELKSANDTLDSLLDIAGGLPVVADPRRVSIERINPEKDRPRSVEHVNLDNSTLKRVLKNGDLLTIASITPRFDNAVTLRGNVDQPVRAPFKEGMRVRDLIPSREYLVSRASLIRQNSNVQLGQGSAEHASTRPLVSDIGYMLDEINWDYAVIERTDPNDMSVSVLPFTLRKIFEDPSGPDNMPLRAGDTVTVFSQSDIQVPQNKRRVIVKVEGEVKQPGIYHLQPGETLHDLLAKAGGPTSESYLFGTEFYRDQVRVSQEKNLDKVVARLEAQLRSRAAESITNQAGGTDVSAQAMEIRRNIELQNANAAIARIKELKPTGRIAFNLDPRDHSFNRLPNLRLQAGDRLHVPARPDFVHVIGAVNAEASPLWKAGTTVDSYLKSAGVTNNADMDAIFVVRADGSVLGNDSSKWVFRGVGSLQVMPGDSIVVPEKLDRETAWSKFTIGVREWSQILANFGLGAAAIKVLK